MKTNISVLCILSAVTMTANAGKIGSDCKFKGVELKGRVKIVNSFPDFKAQIVNAFPDLKVKHTSSVYRCGEWNIVTSSPDFTVQIVNAFPDFKIQYVNAFPGTE